MYTNIFFCSLLRAYSFLDNPPPDHHISKVQFIPNKKMSDQLTQKQVTAVLVDKLPEQNPLRSGKIRIDKTTEKASVIDIIRLMIGCTSGNANTTLSRLDSKNPELTNMQSIRINNVGRFTPVIDIGLIPELVSRILAGARLPLKQKKRICEAWGIQAPLVRSYIECELLQKLVTAFTHLDPIPQFSVGQYRVDLYLRRANIVIECDENDHRWYNQEMEFQREAYIKRSLRCNMVRFDPHKDGWDIFQTINQISRIYEQKLKDYYCYQMYHNAK
jgi:very-short-patch-repair endonuclease